MKQFFLFVNSGLRRWAYRLNPAAPRCRQTCRTVCVKSGKPETIPHLRAVHRALQPGGLSAANLTNPRVIKRLPGLLTRENPDVRAAKEQNYSTAFLARASQLAPKSSPATPKNT